MTAKELQLIESIELQFIELRAIGGANDREVLREIRRILGTFTSSGRFGTLNMSGPAFDNEAPVDPKTWGEPITPWPARGPVTP